MGIGRDGAGQGRDMRGSGREGRVRGETGRDTEGPGLVQVAALVGCGVSWSRLLQPGCPPRSRPPKQGIELRSWRGRERGWETELTGLTEERTGGRTESSCSSSWACRPCAAGAVRPAGKPQESKPWGPGGGTQGPRGRWGNARAPLMWRTVQGPRSGAW